MEDLNDKITGGTLSADEWNQIPSEIQSVIQESGIVLSGASLTQQLQSIYNISRRGLLFVDSGAINAYVLSSAQSQAATEYRNGMIVFFSALNANTSSSTIDVDGLGAKDVFGKYGTTQALTGGEVSGLTALIYDGTSFSPLRLGNPVHENSAPVKFRNSANNDDVEIIDFTSSNLAVLGSEDHSLLLEGQNVFITVGASKDSAITCNLNSLVALYFDGVASFRTQDISTSIITTSSAVYDKDSNFHDIGYNTMPNDGNAPGNHDINSANCGKQIYYTGAGGDTFTVGTDIDVAGGATWVIFNNGSGDLSLVLTSGTLRWFNGVSVSTGTRTLSVGGVCTLTKQTSGFYSIFGAGLS